MDRALRANVIISSLDARGLYAMIPGGDASRPNNGSMQAAIVKSQYSRDSASADADIMAELASATGGTFVQNTNDLKGGLRRIAVPPEYYYVLGFSPQNMKMDGSYHALKVKLRDGGDVTVQARRGYYAPKHAVDAAAQAKQEMEEALFSREEMKDIAVDLHTQFFKASDEKAKLAVLARVDMKKLRFRKADGRNRETLTIISGVFDRNGNYITGIEKVLEMRLKDQTLAALLASGVVVKTSFDVTPGTYVVRLVIRDSEGQMMAARNGAVEIP